MPSDAKDRSRCEPDAAPSAAAQPCLDNRRPKSGLAPLYFGRGGCDSLQWRMSWRRLYRILQPETPGTARPGLSRRAPCDGRGRDRHHARRHGGAVATRPMATRSTRVSDRLRVFLRRIRAAAGRRAGGARRRAPRRDGGRGSPGRPRSAACSISSARCRGCSTSLFRPQLREPVRLHLGVQARPLSRRAWRACGGSSADARHALLSVLLGFRHRAARRGEPRLSAGARRSARAVFGSIPAALWWAIVTLTTTGYGDVVPMTLAGRMLAGVVMVSGILVFALWAGILATGYAEETAAARVSAHLGSRRQGAVLPRCRRRGHRRGGAAAAAARLPGGRGHHAPRRARRLHVFCRSRARSRSSCRPEPLHLGAGEFFGEIGAVDRRRRATPRSSPRALHAVDASTSSISASCSARQPELARIIREEAERRPGVQAG